MSIIKRLLVHNPMERTSAVDLLLSSDMPPPQLENTKFDQIIKDTISKTGSSKYYHLMELCLDQKTEEANILRWLAAKENESNFIRFANDPVPLAFSCLIGSRFPSIIEYFINRCQESGAQYFQVS